MPGAGYSGTPLAKKLGLREGMRVAFVRAPEHLPRLLGRLPGVRPMARPGADMDFLHLFATTRGDLERRVASLEPRLADAGMLWISWPKKGSGVETQLTREVVREVGLAAGLVDVKVCAVDETWSGLKFVRRLVDR